MSSDESVPPAITPKVVAPRPGGDQASTSTRPSAPPAPPSRATETDASPAPQGTVAGMARSSGESTVAVARAGAVKAAAEALDAAKAAKGKSGASAADAPTVKAEKSTARFSATGVDDQTVRKSAGTGSFADPAPAAGSAPVTASAAPSAPEAGAIGTSTGLPPGAGLPPMGVASTADKPSSDRDAPPRTVRLAVSKVNPWSVMKLSFLLSVGIGIMIVVAVTVLWLTLDGMGVFDKANDLITQIVGETTEVDVMQFVQFSTVIPQTLLIVVVNIFITTALATITAFLYNVTASLVGGLHVTLTDD